MLIIRTGWSATLPPKQSGQPYNQLKYREPLVLISFLITSTEMVAWEPGNSVNNYGTPTNCLKHKGGSDEWFE